MESNFEFKDKTVPAAFITKHGARYNIVFNAYQLMVGVKQDGNNYTVRIQGQSLRVAFVMKHLKNKSAWGERQFLDELTNHFCYARVTVPRKSLMPAVTDAVNAIMIYAQMAGIDTIEPMTMDSYDNSLGKMETYANNKSNPEKPTLAVKASESTAIPLYEIFNPSKKAVDKSGKLFESHDMYGNGPLEHQVKTNLEPKPDGETLKVGDIVTVIDQEAKTGGYKMQYRFTNGSIGKVIAKNHENEYTISMMAYFDQTVPNGPFTFGLHAPQGKTTQKVEGNQIRKTIASDGPAAKTGAIGILLNADGCNHEVYKTGDIVEIVKGKNVVEELDPFVTFKHPIDVGHDENITYSTYICIVQDV